MNDQPDKTPNEQPTPPKGISPDEYNGLMGSMVGIATNTDATDETEEVEGEEAVEEEKTEESGVGEEEEKAGAEETGATIPTAKTKPAKDGVAFTLPDGAKVTHEEAKSGYLRQRDYTKKAMELADERKKLERYSGIINYLEGNPDEVEHYIERMKGKGREAQQQAQVKKLTVPAHYKDDPFVGEMVETMNDLREQLAQKADVGMIKATTAQQAKQAEIGVKINTKLHEAYTSLADKLGKSPDSQEYDDKIRAYLADKQMSPEDLVPYILGPDPDYMKSFVERIYQDDIAKAKDKAKASGGKAKTSPEKRAVLKASGKAASTGAGFEVPKTRDGRVDSKELSRQDPQLKSFLGIR